MNFIKEFCKLSLIRRKFFVIPILIVQALFGGLIIFTEGTVVTPFIYAIF
tara:strand:+ start:371 stop:520 length:150 start_codon:yes stop_codon:yes gene_type:complete